MAWHCAPNEPNHVIMDRLYDHNVDQTSDVDSL